MVIIYTNCHLRYLLNKYKYMIIEFITRQIHPHPDQNHHEKLIMQVSFHIKLYQSYCSSFTYCRRNVNNCVKECERLHPPIPPPLSAGDSCRIFSLNRNSTIHLPYLAFVCLSVCLFVIKDIYSSHHFSGYCTSKHSQGSQPCSLWDLYWMQTQLFSIYVHWTMDTWKGGIYFCDVSSWLVPCKNQCVFICQHTFVCYVALDRI